MGTVDRFKDHLREVDRILKDVLKGKTTVDVYVSEDPLSYGVIVLKTEEAMVSID